MSATTIFVGTFIIYSIALIVIGYINTAKSNMTSLDYFQASKSTGILVFMLGTMANMFSSWMFMGNPALFVQHGISAAAWLIHVPCMGLCVWLLWGREYLLINKFGFVTAGDILGDFYESNAVKSLVAAMSIFYCIPYVAIQMWGAGAIITVLSDGYFSKDWGAYVVAVVSIIYLFLGGMKNTTITTAIQGFLLITGFYALAGFIIKDVGIMNVWNAAMNDSNYMTLPGPKGFFPWRYSITYALITAIGIVASPVYPIWISSCKKGFAKLHRTTAFVTWTCLCSFTYIVTVPLVGMGGFSLFPDLATPDNLVPHIMERCMPIAAYCLVGVAAIAAAQSTAAGSLQAATTCVIQDILAGTLGYKYNDKKKVILGRIINIVLIIVSVFAAKSMSGMIAIVGSFAVAFGSMLIPAWIGAMYWPKVTKAGVCWGIVLGAATNIICFIMKSPLGIHFGFSGFIVTCAVAFTISIFTEKPSMAKVHTYHGYIKKNLAERI
ncbi:sodium:solute symporter family protein [Synergistes jonesii]|uniref:sodium:solute symporter family protein n=1 Tax=Synergistes jonesii TaxID=2754 RepID=UPI002430D5D7|nr:sodium:solute symporter family protein [Synergistes jonesii]